MTAPHRTRALAPGIVLLIFVVLLLAVPKTGHPQGTLAPVPVLSSIERSGHVSLARDCGYSAPPSASRSLWLFCDTAVYVRKTNAHGRPAWTLQRFIAGYANFCRAIIGQPELSTPGELVQSYFDPAAGAHGHVLVAGFRW